jgi:hypothetical protein
MIDTLKKILGRKVSRLFFVVWPPFGESDIGQLDISAGYVFVDEPDTLFIISTDKNDLTTPCIFVEKLPNNIFRWEDLEKRVSKWMNCSEEMEIDFEYYEATNESLFLNIVNNNIIQIELVGIVNNNNPIGIKLLFENDYVLSSPIIDGNTIETKCFHKTNNLSNFHSLGQLEYRAIMDI